MDYIIYVLILSLKSFYRRTNRFIEQLLDEKIGGGGGGGFWLILPMGSEEGGGMIKKIILTFILYIWCLFLLWSYSILINVFFVRSFSSCVAYVSSISLLVQRKNYPLYCQTQIGWRKCLLIIKLFQNSCCCKASFKLCLHMYIKSLINVQCSYWIMVSIILYLDHKRIICFKKDTFFLRLGLCKVPRRIVIKFLLFRKIK